MLVDGAVHVLDLAGKVDETATYLTRNTQVHYPPPFGRALTQEVRGMVWFGMIAELRTIPYHTC